MDSVAETSLLSGEEHDQLERSNKKTKGSEGNAGVNEISIGEELNIAQKSPTRKKSPYSDALQGVTLEEDEVMLENPDSSETDQNGDDEFVAISGSEDEGEEDERCPRVRFTPSEKNALWKPWKHSIICRVLGRRVGFNFLSSKLYKFWQKRGTMELIDLSNDFYLTKFSAKEDFLDVLKGGPWMVADHLVSLAKWHPNFDPFDVQMTKITAWVRFTGIPIEYFNGAALMKLGNLVGRALYVDNTTLNATRGKYARACVELDLSKPLLGEIPFEEQDLPNRIRRIAQYLFLMWHLRAQQRFMP